MKAFLILEDGNVFTGKSIGSTRDMISEIVFNTSMTGYLEILTDPSYAGQAIVMTYPLIGNYGVCYKDMESRQPWADGYIVREIARTPSNFRSENSIENFLKEKDIPGIEGIDTRALTKILREEGTMNGMITTNENYVLEDVIKKLKEYRVKNVVMEDYGSKDNIADCLLKRGCDVTIYPAFTKAEEILAEGFDGIMLSNGPGDPAECVDIIEEIKKMYASDTQSSGKRFKFRKSIYFHTKSWVCSH
ncbi:MAG: carbamoyl-phosphate synthase [Anaerocolumna sp.]|nr:carbamoyl-phosphate synthase [Anaerocolumna sp.]